MTTCRDCGAPIQFLPHPKTGKATPYDDPLPPPPNHYQSRAHIAATRKNGAKPKKAPAVDPVVALVVGWLRSDGYRKDDAESWVAAVPGTFGPEDADLLYVKAVAAGRLDAITKMGEG